jgi:hypothetical protein
VMTPPTIVASSGRESARAGGVQGHRHEQGPGWGGVNASPGPCRRGRVGKGGRKLESRVSRFRLASRQRTAEFPTATSALTPALTIPPPSKCSGVGGRFSRATNPCRPRPSYPVTASVLENEVHDDL